MDDLEKRLMQYGAEHGGDGWDVVQMLMDIRAADRAEYAKAEKAAEATRNMMRDTENANLRQQLNYAQMQGLFCGIPRINPYGYGVYAYPTCSGVSYGTCTNI